MSNKNKQRVLNLDKMIDETSVTSSKQLLSKKKPLSRDQFQSIKNPMVLIQTASNKKMVSQEMGHTGFL